MNLLKSNLIRTFVLLETTTFVFEHSLLFSLGCLVYFLVRSFDIVTIDNADITNVRTSRREITFVFLLQQLSSFIHDFTSSFSHSDSSSESSSEFSESSSEFSQFSFVNYPSEVTVEDAKIQTEKNARQHLTNRLREINNLVADFKERSIKRQKEYICFKKEEPSICTTPIDFYNMGSPIETPPYDED